MRFHPFPLHFIPSTGCRHPLLLRERGEASRASSGTSSLRCCRIFKKPTHFDLLFLQVPGAVLGGIKSTVAGLMRVSNDGDGDDHEFSCGSTQGGGLWGAKHLAVEEDTGADALAEKEGTTQLRGLPQVCMRDYILPTASKR